MNPVLLDPRTSKHMSLLIADGPVRGGLHAFGDHVILVTLGMPFVPSCCSSSIRILARCVATMGYRVATTSMAGSISLVVVLVVV